MPKGVLWRQADIFVECFGGVATTALRSTARRAGRRRDGDRRRLRALLAPPFMHGAGHWMSFLTWHGGGTVFVQTTPERLDPVDIWSLIERERVTFLLIVGDAFARPLLDELRPAALRPVVAHRRCCRAARRCRRHSRRSSSRICPTLMIVDGLGSSEAGGQLPHVSAGGARLDGHVRDDRRQRTCCRPTSTACSAPGDDEIGWLAKSGPARARLPRRRRQDRAHLSRWSTACATRCPAIGPAAATDGMRRAARPRLGHHQLRRREDLRRGGRGGDQVPPRACTTVVVAGRPSERWGNEVVAIVQLRDGVTAADEADCWPRPSSTSPATSCRRRSSSSTRSCARRRGKADYRWARRSPPASASEREPSAVPRENDNGPWTTWCAICSSHDPRRGIGMLVSAIAVAARPDPHRAVPGVRTPDVARLPELQALRCRPREP